MKEYIDEHLVYLKLPIEIMVEVIYGGRIFDLTSKAIRVTQDFNFDFDLVLIFWGVSNLTSVHSSGRVTPIYYEAQHLLHSLSEQFTSAQAAFCQHSYVPKLVFGRLCGIDIQRYNIFKTGYSQDYNVPQQAINNGVIGLNISIKVLNDAVGTIAPWTTDDVHSYQNGRHTHKYQKMYDGLHPNDTLLARWALQIVKSLRTNLQI